MSFLVRLCVYAILGGIALVILHLLKLDDVKVSLGLYVCTIISVVIGSVDVD
jgi:uncharacterized membrane protein